jgi:hypothetical protein
MNRVKRSSEIFGCVTLSVPRICTPSSCCARRRQPRSRACASARTGGRTRSQRLTSPAPKRRTRVRIACSVASYRWNSKYEVTASRAFETVLHGGMRRCVMVLEIVSGLTRRQLYAASRAL